MSRKDNKQTDKALGVMYARADAEKSNKKRKEKNDADMPRKPIDKRTLSAIIGGVFVLAVALLLFFLIKGEADRRAEEKRQAAFAYLTSNLADYVSFPKDKSYKDFTVDIAIAKPHKKNEDGTGVSDVENAIIQILATKAEKVGDGAGLHDHVIGVGDITYIRYRGYLVDPETGAEIVVSGMSNLAAQDPSSLTIGSGGFVAGFELGLIGMDTSEFARFVKITTGKPDPEKHVAYVDFVRYPLDKDGNTVNAEKLNQTGVRIDLSETETIKDTFGEGFLEAICAQDIGTKFSTSKKLDEAITIGDKKYQYKDVNVQFVTTCEKEETNGGKPIKTVEVYFPYSYGTTGTSSAKLRNETAYFEVYVDYTVDYSVPEWNDAFLRTILAEEDVTVTEEEINEFEGDTLVEKYENFLWDSFMKEYDEKRESLIEEAIWSYYLKNAKIKEYPTHKVNEIYDEYVKDVEDQFERTGGGLTDESTGEYKVFETLDEFARAYLGLSEKQSWKTYLKEMCQSLIKERLVLYYIMHEENLAPTAEAFKEKYDSLRAEYLEEYIEQYLDSKEKKREDYNDEQWAEFTKEREKEIFDYYDEDYFEETTYYEIVLETMLKWPKVNDLEDGAYVYPSELKDK